MAEKYIRDFQHSMTIIVAVLLILAYQVFYTQRNQLQDIECRRKYEGFENTYATRQQVIADSGLTSTNVAVWGNDPGSSGYICPGSKQSSFFGGPEPPVFYDIGDVQAVRGTRSRGDYTYDAQGNVTGSDDVNWEATDQYGRLFFPEITSDGVTRYISRGTFCEKNPSNLNCSTSKAAMDADTNYKPKLVAPGPGWSINAKGQWVKAEGMFVPIDRESFTSDEKLLYGY
jgi:hypothetical protein